MQSPRRSQPATTASIVSAHSEDVQSAVLQALTDGNQRILVSMLEAGEWAVEGNEVVIKSCASRKPWSICRWARMPERLAIASASGVLGRAMKLKDCSRRNRAAAEETQRNGDPRNALGPGGRGRAEQDAVVRRMQEKFGAEIRTVIDYKEKR